MKNKKSSRWNNKLPLKRATEGAGTANDINDMSDLALSFVVVAFFTSPVHFLLFCFVFYTPSWNG